MINSIKGERMKFVKVIEVSELAKNQMIMVNVDDKEVLLANVDGAFYAIANKCSHMGGSLAKGVLDGKTVTCPRHGAQFDLLTGKAVGEAKIALLKIQVKDQDDYQVKVEGNNIMLGIPE
jgi:3-phenylpropionate/trans-cinnamate dioxygenase ferredoxin subunit